MGLDNGICIKRDTVSTKAQLAFDQEWTLAYGYDLGVAYWRKCWNIRNIVFDICNIEEFNDSCTILSIEQIKEIIKELKSMNKYNYCDRGDCIWDWEDFKRNNKKNIAALKQLIKFMKETPTMEVYFYDSW